ncbi:hypothetical protein Aple_024930 [Acrocarpospora pleiomorpha]|uniref:Uncharacterized protein n=1 Tax=Acrocarpospora pleiomorpha TaxID=90975 RepID=A0A5M3XDB5_9ACTN|nr:hypothetical protein [Acrocarpospora pleiomorpha]GES19597.1 hypothetical protein Aple_024930 [Acrocarpospora pleiomorpha]
MARSKSVRRDARENVAKLHAAALDIFLAKGLDAPLEEATSCRRRARSSAFRCLS